MCLYQCTITYKSTIEHVWLWIINEDSDLKSYFTVYKHILIFCSIGTNLGLLSVDARRIIYHEIQCVRHVSLEPVMQVRMKGRIVEYKL